MTGSVTLAVPNAILFVVGSDRYAVPNVERGSSIWSTSTCIALGCTPDADGETRITIGSSAKVRLPRNPAFEGELATPHRIVKIDIVPGRKVLEESVPDAVTRVRIWTNHPVEPDDIVIVVG